VTRTLAQRISEGSYDGYAYAYPHKTAYRQINPPIPLQEAWASEEKAHLFLYVHLPFCEMRCGFCNLFTTVRPGATLTEQTLAAIERQSKVVADAISPERVAQAAFGGGTPSFLTESALERLFDHLSATWPIQSENIPASFEVSPGTISSQKLELLKQRGIDRVSLGVQSFVPEDLISLKRPQPAGQLETACHLIKAAGFSVFNIDLIYGNEGQDAKRWQRTLNRTVEWLPEEIYIYPLYVGKLTNLDRSGKKPGARRRELYLQARDFLMAAGYRQISMRLFRRAGVVRDSEYCCQEDGMIGLGPGARSYTRGLHYSTEYAVGQTGVRAIIEDFVMRQTPEYAAANYGAVLNAPEQKRRYLIKSLLRVAGLSMHAYHRRFESDVLMDFPQLQELFALRFAAQSEDLLQLNGEGLSWSDSIGPWLYSEETNARMGACELV
jgi:oxygen-independent coproporphyrinogen-3 oxidase